MKETLNGVLMALIRLETNDNISHTQ